MSHRPNKKIETTSFEIGSIERDLCQQMADFSAVSPVLLKVERANNHSQAMTCRNHANPRFPPPHDLQMRYDRFFVAPRRGRCPEVVRLFVGCILPPQRGEQPISAPLRAQRQNPGVDRSPIAEAPRQSAPIQFFVAPRSCQFRGSPVFVDYILPRSTANSLSALCCRRSDKTGRRLTANR